MRVLILGGTRFIGWHIASTLKNTGHHVAVFHRGTTPLQELSGIEEILGEKTKLPTFRDEFRLFRPEAVIDCIGYTPSDGARIIETFKGWLERLIFLSSCDVYRAHAVLQRATDEPVQDTPLHEGSSLRTNAFPYRKPGADPDDWRYRYDKIPIEQLLLAEPTFQATGLRLPAVYGPRDHQRRVWEYLRKMDAGRKAIVVGGHCITMDSARRLLFSAHDLETAFSCQTTSLEISNSLPSLLRNVAQEIEKHV
jgi:nucleoside-diphosphate-sugar epimerase